MEKERLTEELGRTEINDIESPETLDDMTSEQFTDGHQEGAIANPVEDMNHQPDETSKEVENINSEPEIVNDQAEQTNISEHNETDVLVETLETNVNVNGESISNEIEPIAEAFTDRHDTELDSSADVQTDNEELPIIEEEAQEVEPTVNLVSETAPAISEEVNSESKDSVEEHFEAAAPELKEEVQGSEEQKEPEATVEPEPIDYSKCSKLELQEALVDLVRKDDIASVGGTLNDIKKYFDGIEKGEKEIALNQFIADGEDKDAFKFQLDEVSQKLLANYQILRDRRHKYYKPEFDSKIGQFDQFGWFDI